MESRLSFQRNDLEPVLLMFPFGLVSVAVILDVFDLLGGPGLIGTLAYWTVAAALVGGTLTLLAAQVRTMCGGRRANARQSVLRGRLDGGVLIIFAVIWLLRMSTQERTVGPGLLVVELLGLALAGIGVAVAVPAAARQQRGSNETARSGSILPSAAQGPMFEGARPPVA